MQVCQGWYDGREVAMGSLQTSGTSSRPLTGISRQKRPRRTIQVSQGWYSGREVAVGSLTDLWHKLQASSREKQAEEAQGDDAVESRVVFWKRCGGGQTLPFGEGGVLENYKVFCRPFLHFCSIKGTVQRDGSDRN